MVTIFYSRRKIHAHRVLLTANNHYFQDLFDRPGSKGSRIELEGDDPDALKVVLQWIYSVAPPDHRIDTGLYVDWFGHDAVDHDHPTRAAEDDNIEELRRPGPDI